MQVELQYLGTPVAHTTHKPLKHNWMKIADYTWRCVCCDTVRKKLPSLLYFYERLDGRKFQHAPTCFPSLKYMEGKINE